MGKFILRRILLLIPIMLGVMFVLFAIRSFTPGDPVDQLLPSTATEEERDAKREELGLNDPLPVQFVNYVVHAVQGDLGESYTSHQGVLGEILHRFPYTCIVCFGAVFIGLIIGIPLGIISALRQYSWLDSIILVLSMISAACPGFVLALLLISEFSVNLHWLPAVGVQGWTSYILPIVSVGLGSMSHYTRITRTSFLEVVRQDYIRTARSKGQKEVKIITSHALRNAFIPIAANIGNQLGHQLGGALIVETVFGIPGIGKYIGDAISARNFPAIQGGVLFLAFVFTIINILTDISFVAINPRLKDSMIKRKPKSLKKSLTKTA